MFQSTHSRGVRHAWILSIPQYTAGFNPRTHEECDSPELAITGTLSPVSIHALTRSATISQVGRHRIEKVSIHALTRSATIKIDIIITTCVVSIHALTRSATDTFCCYTTITKFQSTHSRGVRQERQNNLILNRLFQSTHSRGVRR